MPDRLLSAALSVASPTANGTMSSGDKTKLDGVAAGATANATDAFLLERANHTGTQVWGSITGTPTTVAGYGITDALNTSHEADTTAVHGIADTAALVTLTGVQALTGKTLNDFSNVIEADALHVPVRNDSGAIIGKGAPVYISGYNVGAEIVTVALADASSAATMPAIGLTEDAIANNASGAVDAVGRISGVDTSAYTVGTKLYVSETPGTLTATAPVAPAIAQHIGTVLRSHATLGVIEVVSNAPASNSTGGGHTIQDEGIALTQRANLDFQGAGVAVTDDGVNNKTIVTIGGGGGSLTVREVDGAPAVTATAIEFPNGTLTEPTAGVARYTPSAAGGGAITAIGAPVVLAATAATISWANIPQTYRSLWIKGTARSTHTGNTYTYLRFNGVATSTYDWVLEYVTAAGTTPTTGGGLATTSAGFSFVPGTNAPAGYAGGIDLLIPDYTNTTWTKRLRNITPLIAGTAAGDIQLWTFGGHWRSTAAITSIEIYPGAGAWAIGTTFQLYGVS